MEADSAFRALRIRDRDDQCAGRGALFTGPKAEAENDALLRRDPEALGRAGRELETRALELQGCE
ncbi:MAG: hypothetical protein AAF851_22310 [Myxococcota bacterium]